MYPLLPFQEQEQETAISHAYPQPLGVSLDGYDIISWQTRRGSHNLEFRESLSPFPTEPQHKLLHCGCTGPTTYQDLQPTAGP